MHGWAMHFDLLVRSVSVREFIESLPGFDHYTFKESATLAKQAFDTCFAREATFDAFFAAFHEHVKSWQPKLAGESVPLRPKLQATMGAPGSGKSYFLDQLRRLMDPKKCVSMMQHCPTSLRHWFDEGNVLSINISFNGDTGFDRDESLMDIEQAFVLRVLYSYVPG
jgi:hypothetical protein